MAGPERGVAQRGSAHGSGPGSRRFKSSRPDHFPPPAGRRHPAGGAAMPDQSAVTAAEIVVEGRVQGVGYRDYARRHAERLGLAGYVMNLDDGRVRARAEGPRDVIETFVRALEKGPPLSQVRALSVHCGPAPGPFAAFLVPPASAPC